MSAPTKSKRASEKVRAPREGAMPKGLTVVYPNCAGIDIGSRSHYVSVPEKRDERPIREFGCYTPDLEAMAEWLKECKIDTVVMESTGVYWKPVFSILVKHGFDVKLVDVRNMRRVPGRKSDVSDCQWLQNLGTHGLLRPCFIPEEMTQTVQAYWRHRDNLVEMRAHQIHLMQKSLEQMNVQLHKAVTDITGETGMSIIRAILAGERDPVTLAKLRRPNVKSSEEELAKALTGNYAKEHLFVLGQVVTCYDFHLRQIEQCDRETEAYLVEMERKIHPDRKARRSPGTGTTKSRKPRKNQPRFNLAKRLENVLGVDLTSIDGICGLTAMKFFTEVGCTVDAFPNEKAFSSWLRLCPNNRKTGGKVKSTRTLPSQNRLSTALRVAAQALHHSKSALGAYSRQMRSHLGAPKAITATAHRLAILIYRMVRYGKEYVDEGEAAYQERQEKLRLARLKRSARAQGYLVMDPATGQVLR